MKRLVFWQLFVAALLLTSNSHAQSIKDLFNKENIEKAVNAVTGKSTADMTGTWSYTGSAIEFESDNLLQKAGGAVAATAAEKKLDEQLAKVGIKAGQMSFTFNADSTFSAKVGQKSMKNLEILKEEKTKRIAKVYITQMVIMKHLQDLKSQKVLMKRVHIL